MNDNGTLDRRAFLERAMMIGLAAGSAGLVSACDGGDAKKSGGTGRSKTSRKGDGGCSDLGDLKPADIKVREQLAYVEVSKVQGKNCLNCGLFQAKKPCGGCSVIKGPIAEKGYCTAWAPKA